MSYHAPPPPPLLLTKRVTAFLHANLTTELHTAALTTPTGKLLAHASSREPARVLRRQCAVAASLWALHSGNGRGRPGSATSAEIAPSSPNAASPDKDTVVSGTSSWRGRPQGEVSPTVTVQLDNGATFVMRRLRCGMLFVCIGDSGEPQGQGQNSRRGSGPHPPREQIGEGSESGGTSTAAQNEAGAATPSAQAGSPSEGGSFLSGGTLGPGATAGQATSAGAAAGVMRTASSAASFRSLVSNAGTGALKRQVEELARWLDDKLGPLTVPEEGIGISTGWDLR